MMREQDRPWTANFGRVDPFCWVLLVPMVLFGAVLIIDIDRLIGALIIVMAILIAVLDSWINRPGARPSRSPRRR